LSAILILRGHIASGRKEIIRSEFRIFSFFLRVEVDATSRDAILFSQDFVVGQL